jgi:hypothetical protein
MSSSPSTTHRWISSPCSMMMRSFALPPTALNETFGDASSGMLSSAPQRAQRHFPFSSCTATFFSPHTVQFKEVVRPRRTQARMTTDGQRATTSRPGCRHLLSVGRPNQRVVAVRYEGRLLQGVRARVGRATTSLSVANAARPCRGSDVRSSKATMAMRFPMASVRAYSCSASSSR